ncbi:probable G-protein coupled receptor 179 [Gavia stellata]|uniref:probable G-protein coupled receptor 179 n=1 Tax=Gavia stellata TaxID=37040 RepID=UPI0028A1BE46|nr:probable G-protein coupled receptor 179 [Gavia stellata]
MGPWQWPLLWCLHAALVRTTILTGGQRPQERPPQPPGWSPAPSSSWAPTLEPGAAGDPQDSAAALAFLQTGDAQQLARVNCSRGVAAGAPGPGPPPALRATLRAAPEALAQAANFLNMLFQTNDIREASVAEDVEWYQALVRSLAEGHPWVRRAVLALDAHPLATKPRLMLQATKGDSEILLQDVSSAAPSLGNLSWDNEWFNALRSQRTLLLRKRVLSNDLRSMETPKWQRGDSYVGEPGHVRWSPPFLECRDGRFLPAWAVTLSAAFYGLKPDLSPEFKGVVRVDIELRDVAIDQCASGPGWFADTHRCDLNSTQCVPQESRSFVLGRYLCRCKPGFYGAGGVASSAWAGAAGADGGSRLACRPCRRGCATCEDDAPCLIQEDRALRAAVLSCQAFCMLAVFLSMLVSYHFRRSKRIRASGVVLLETILFGSLLLYFPVFILYFKPSIFRCIVLRWVRMLGFAIVYGTITLKLHRVLKVFLSRTAQRVPYVSSERVLRMLGLILLLVLWFLAAWTIGMLENVDKNIPLVIRTQTAHGLHFYICGHDRWDYMMVIAEMLFLLWGSFLCYATRTVPSAFHEPRYMGIALHNELMISATFHVVRFIMVPSLHPDWTLLLFFAHTHSTITMTLALLFIPKFLHAGSPLREEIAAEVYEDELDMRRSGSCLNSSIASAWSEHSLDPDDIREELKKLYTQLEVHKSRRMAANNPHLPKKRSSRRSLGRSIVRRVAELPEAVARRSSGGEQVGTPARHGSSAKRLPNASGTSLRIRSDGSRRRAAALRKSRSTEGPTQEPWGGSPALGPPGEPVPGRKTMAVMASEQSDSESLDAAPLVCKSASAHNLAGHEQHPQLRAAPLQKSLSVIAGAREEALLATSRAAREEWHHNWHPSALSPQSPGAAGALPPASSSPAEGCSQEDMSPPGDGKMQKHVTYAPIKSISVDSSHLPGRVRVAVRRTPPLPPVRYQSLVQRAAPAGDSPEPAEPPTDPPARAGEPERTPEGSAEEKPGRASPPAGKGRLLTAASIPAQVCPWELVQEEILSWKQKAAEAADSGTPGDAAATPPSLKPPIQKTSLRGLGLAIKAFNRSRGKSILRGKREGEGSLRRRGCEREAGGRRERPSLADMSAVSLGAIGRDPTAKSPEWSRRRPGSEPTARPRHGETGAPAVPAGKGALLRQEAIASQEDSGVPLGGESPAKVLEKGGSQPEPLGPGGSWAGKAGSAAGRQAVVCPGETQADASSKTEICPWEESGGEHRGPGRAPGKGGSEVDPGCSGEEPGMEKRPAKTPELPKAASETAGTAEDRMAEVCPWETEEGKRTVRAEICPWDVEGRGSPRPGEGAEQPGTGLAAKDPALPKMSSKQAGAIDSKKANICPWEVEDEPLAKTEICPWEAPAGPSGTERPSQDTRGTSKGENKPGSGGLEDIKAKLADTGGHQPDHRDTRTFAKLIRKSPECSKAESKTSQSTVSIKEAVCPWESLGTEQPPEQPRARRAALPKSPSRKSQSVESLKAEVCPWESLGMEQLPEKPHAASPMLPKSPSKKSQSVESLKAEVCPWEALEVKVTDKAEICPWDAAAPPSGKEKSRQDKGALSVVSRSPSTGQGLLKEIADSTSAKKEKAEVCPWESLGMEQPPEKPRARSPALPKSPSRKSQNVESLKVEVCPWEAPEVEASDKAEICPWDVAAPSSDQPKAKQGPGGASKGDKRITRQAALASPVRSLEKGSSEREAVCPWESLGTEQPPEKPCARSPALPKSPSKKSQSVESLKAEVCPWELEPTDKAEICPWDAAAPPSGKEKSRQDKGALSIVSKSPSTGQGLLKEIGDNSTSRKKEKASGDRESICPWESTDMESSSTGYGTKSTELLKATAKKSDILGSTKAEVCPWESLGMEQPPEKPRARSPALPKSPSKKSQSVESLKAEVCPWEAPELESTDKAEICPWDAAAPPSGKEKLRQDKGALSIVSRSPSTGQGLLKEIADSTSAKKEKASRDRESICPWESLGTEQPPAKPHTGSPALLKSPSRKSQRVESLKPPEFEAGFKAEICPWEAALPLPEKGAAPGMAGLPPKIAGASKALEKRSSEHEAICPQESLGTEEPSLKTAMRKEPSKKSDSMESRKSDICPWEGAEPMGLEKESFKPGVHPEGADRAFPPGTGKSKPVAEASTMSPTALLKKSKGRSDGEAEHKPLCRILPGIQPPRGPRAEPLPRGASAAPTAGSSPSPGASVAEVCPWEAEDTPPASNKTGTDTEKTSEVCPWEVESVDPTPTLRRQGRAGASPQDRGRGASETKPDVCPWDHE